MHFKSESDLSQNPFMTYVLCFKACHKSYKSVQVHSKFIHMDHICLLFLERIETNISIYVNINSNNIYTINTSMYTLYFHSQWCVDSPLTQQRLRSKQPKSNPTMQSPFSFISCFLLFFSPKRTSFAHGLLM